jgi:hypothetical protein
MASIDDLTVQLQVALNRNQIRDANNIDQSSVWWPLQINMAIHTLERRIVTPFQTYSFPLTLSAGVQTYPLTNANTYLYRATLGISMPWQSIITVTGQGQRLTYQPIEAARSKWQFLQTVTGNTLNTGQPVEYSIFWSAALTPPQPAYWFWPTPDKPYVVNVDQKQGFVDLVTGQVPAQTNWFTLNVPDLVLWEAAMMSSEILKDDRGIQRFKLLRDEAFLTATVLTGDMQFGEQGAPAGMMEPG